MATLNLTTPPSFTRANFKHKHNHHHHINLKSHSHLPSHHHLPHTISTHHFSRTLTCFYKVIIDHEGESTELEVDPDENILEKALDSGIPIPYDCKLGVCMTCPAKLVSGEVDQSEGMLSDDVIERGYALLCAAHPRSDCRIKTIPEEELLSMQLATAND